MSICNFCRTGADMQHRAIEINEDRPRDRQIRSDLRTVGVELHNYCKGKTSCDCQHHVVDEGNIRVG